MSREYLDFERPIAELEQKIEELCHLQSPGDVTITEEVKRLQDKVTVMTQSIFSKLTAQQVVQIARHPNRPHSVDYINHIFTDFDELHGDRHFARASALMGGTARLNGLPVMVLGQEKGRNTKNKVERNFGMLKPEGFRKALRLMKLAEKFSMPIITFIDTPGAYPGVGAEERNQSEAIARNLLEMSQLKVPILCVVIGEGCSGGALGIGVGDRIIMLQYSYYSVISPEGCASILWKSADKAADAAKALRLTADCLKQQGLIDEVLDEPVGGAHRDPEFIMSNLRQSLTDNLQRLLAMSTEDLLQKRYDYWMSKGRG
jgi:acetyl-CoA carboxylase carboxyl transferase subunit alpha